MSVKSGGAIPVRFRHQRVGRWPCAVCGFREKLDELRLYVATVYDRGVAIIRACRRCQPKRERLAWKEKQSFRRLERRVLAQGFGRGRELEHTRRRLGLGSCERPGARATR